MTKQKKERRKRKLESEDSDRRNSFIMKKEKVDVDENVYGVNSLLPTRMVYNDQLIVLLKQSGFVIVEGDVGCGKTFLVKHVAGTMGVDVRIMQMGDQIDSKSLFGSYECTEVAGHFKWKKSQFYEWLCQPGIILIEDIDSAHCDVVNSLIRLCETRRVILPSGDFIHLDKHCMICATIQSNRVGTRRNGVLDGVFSRISLPSLSDDELKRLGKCLFPRIGHIVNSICKIFRELESLRGGSNSRKLTSSDLIRAFNRINGVNNLSSSEFILLELLDVWCICEPSIDRRTVIASKIASLLSLTIDQVEYALRYRVPTISIKDDEVCIGRVNMRRRSHLSIESTRRLGHTKGALQLLERMARCLSNNEAVLLVGEAGVGKTSLVQILADILGEKLKIVNVGPHSDADDLMTSLRPTSFGRLLEPFTKDFISLFSSSFDLNKNTKFIHNLEMYLMHNRYEEYLSIVEETCRKILSKTKDIKWGQMVVRCKRLSMSLSNKAPPFALQRGAVKEATEEGYWLLIDEINLASPECLDCIVEAISTQHHSQFRLLACMNPATDTSKRRLPQSIRSKFIELFVHEDCDEEDLNKIVVTYLPSSSLNIVQTIVKLYIEAKNKFASKMSLRTLTRALIYTGDCQFDNDNRCLYEAFSMAFLSNLDDADKEWMKEMIKKSFPCEGLRRLKNIVNKDEYIIVEGYPIERGDIVPKDDDGYIMTETVKENIGNVARIVSNGRLAVLLEGETSAGKTSIVVHLAKITGNVVRRINNHEQTDIQEYIGSYVPDCNGRLYFHEGALVEAVRKGYWVILDELNLAPSDVIETLNRLLDDNRELFISESNEVVKAHPRFRLFATQNPAGTYAGRKRLSRALISRFVLLKFPILPLTELSRMVCARCKVAPSAAKKMIEVLSELRLQRSLAGVFSSKDGLMTLRDLFRWAMRLSSDNGNDWKDAMIHHGFFLLAGRCRNEIDKNAVISTLESVLKGKIDESYLFSCESPYFPSHLDTSNVVLTMNMRRMIVLSWQAFIRNEAILVIGETGDGKTRLAQTLGGNDMLTINCHERTESSDLLGRLRPINNGGFMWQDGVVIEAMKEGRVLLMDEISLAEDSVLERLNPLFEDKRCILLTDGGSHSQEIIAKDEFKVIATMNPGGDYGKKELSKALRNRFTEIWSSSSFERSELLALFTIRLPEKDRNTDESITSASKIIDWIMLFHKKFAHVLRVVPSIRDIVACAEMFTALRNKNLSIDRCIIETLSSVFIDAIQCQLTRSINNIEEIEKEAQQMMHSMIGSIPVVSSLSCRQINMTDSYISIDDIIIPYGPNPSIIPKEFSLNAPTCMENMYRIMRAMSINKPILLEGSPGCGKSSLIIALASIGGYPITRLNLSEQTDLSDLFGSDVPIIDDDGNMSFEWKDGPVLKAIKNGEWILLDEMNLASQSILEGLNACFDHRRVLYIAELSKEFSILDGSSCRFFACQNPRIEGGNRRALPKSFVNRFTNIYTADLSDEDELIILRDSCKGINEDILRGMVKVNCELEKEIWCGGPFSFNLRDINRWIQLIDQNKDIGYSFELLYVSRLRLEKERERARDILNDIMGILSHSRPSIVSIHSNTLRIGPLIMERGALNDVSSLSRLHLLPSQSNHLLYLLTCIHNGWIPLVIGPRNCGKRSIIECGAILCGRQLEILSLSSDTDASELIGSFEQKVDMERLPILIDTLYNKLRSYVKVEDIEGLKKCIDVMSVEIFLETLLSKCTVPSEVINELKDIVAKSSKNEMYFEWVNSTFVNAYMNGGWILIENVNACNAAVLDRLNCSLERGGSLVLNESKGDYEPITPHPQFRVILSMDSSEGEISRAMRNRSVELYMDDEECKWNQNERDIKAILSSLSHKSNPSSKLCHELANLEYRDILYSGVLLSELEEDTIYRLFNKCNVDDDDMSDCKDTIMIPSLLSYIDDDKRIEYQMKLWMESCESEESIRMALPILSLLSSSKQLLDSNQWKDIVNRNGIRMYNRIKPYIPSTICISHPIDSSFNGDFNINTNTKLWYEAVLEWTLLMIEDMKYENESSLHLNINMSLYEMTSSPFYFDKMELSLSMKKELMKYLKRDGTRIDGKMMISHCLSIISMIQSLSCNLQMRSGDTPIKIAYSNMKKMNNEIMEINQWNICSSHCLYIERYKTSRVMNPFTNVDQVNQLIECVRNATEIDGERQLESSFLNSLSYISNGIEGSLSLSSSSSTNHIIIQNPIGCKWVNVIDKLNWRDDNDERRCLISCHLIHNIGDDISLISLISTSSISLLLSHLWNKLDWDVSLRNITCRHLRNLSLDSFLSQLWRIGGNVRRIHNTIRECISLIVPPSQSISSSSSSSHNILSYGISLMDECIPPISSLDPVIYTEEYSSFLHYQLNIIDCLLSTLSNWRSLNGSSSHKVDYNSPHEFIQSLYDSKKKIEDELNRYQNMEKNTVYRENCRQYGCLMREMHSFSNIVHNVECLINNNEWNKDGCKDDEIDLILSKITSCIASASNFIKDGMIRFGSLIDVMGGYWICLWMIKMSLSCIHQEICEWRYHRQMISSAVFPSNLDKSCISWLGTIRPSLMSWGVSSCSPLPLTLQSSIIQWKILNGEGGILDIEWIRNEWSKWYNKYGAAQNKKEFEYKNKTMEEKEEIEMNEMFNRMKDMEGSLNEEDLNSLLDSFIHINQIDNIPIDVEKRLITAIAYLSSITSNMGMKEEWLSSGLDGSLYVLSRMDEGNDIDVYKETNKNEVKEAMKELEDVERRVEELRQLWPEIQSLVLILEAIENMLNCSLSHGHMRMAAMLEKILEEVEEWEKLADRSNSLEEVVIPLRSRLIKWKKMEIGCWHRLICRIKKESEERTRLVAYPLFDGLFQCDESSLIAMAADWISHSSLIDFEERIASIEILASWSRIMGKNELNDSLLSISSFYSQYKDICRLKLKEIIDPIEKSIKQLVTVAQYKDLNLLSIKASAQKNHIQLFKLIRKLKDESGNDINNILDESINIDHLSHIQSTCINYDMIEDEERVIVKAHSLVVETLNKRDELIDSSKWIELADSLKELSFELKRRIEYEGDEKEMESIQGRERNRRQRGVALIIRELQNVGISSRRSISLNGEMISKSSLCSLPYSYDNKMDGIRLSLIRATTHSRNILIRRGMKPNEQLSVSTRGHMLGMVEYGCYWLIENEIKCNEWMKISNEMKRINKCILNGIENQKRGGWKVNHEVLKNGLKEMKDKSDELNELIRSMSIRMDNVPHICPPSYLSSISSPLSLLTNESEEVIRVKTIIGDLNGMYQLFKSHLIQIELNGECSIYSKSVFYSNIHIMKEKVMELKKKSNELKMWFEEEGDMIESIISSISYLIESLICVEEEEEEEEELVYSSSYDCILIFIQRLYKSSIDGENGWKDKKSIDRLIHSFNTLQSSKPSQMISFVSSIVDKMRNGIRIDNLNELSNIFSLSCHLFNSSLSIHQRCSHIVSLTIHRLAQIGIQLMEKGYMNTIPKEGKEEGEGGGDGKEANGEGGGMGEGKGTKDVTEEMEETGQIDSLKGDEDNADNDNDRNGEKNDRTIEMDEDFAEDLEDIDKNGADDDGDNDDDDNNDDINMDDNMGEVDDKEDEELDPHLWDDEKDEEEKKKNEMDQDNKGADEETGEMAANEDDCTPMEKNEKNDDKGDKGDEDIENCDENDRDNEKDERTINDNNDDMNGNEDDDDDEKTNEEDKDMIDDGDIQMNEDVVDEDEDEGEGEEDKDGDGDNNDDENEENMNEMNGNVNEDNEEDMKNDEVEEEEKEEEDKIEGGSGGIDNDNDKEKEKEKNGYGNDRDIEDNDEDINKEDNNDNGDGNSDNMMNKENETMRERNEKKDKEQNDDENREKEKKKRNIVDSCDDEVEEEEDLVEGTKDEDGNEREENESGTKYMSGGGSLEEAKDSMKRNNIDKKERNNVDVSCIDYSMNEDGDEDRYDNETLINISSLDTVLTEKLSNELVIGKEMKELEVDMKIVDEVVDEDKVTRSEKEWEIISGNVSILASELAENLRLILEPRLATKMEGDYRSGKRLNMKKIIPYIASQYRKNRIWMRRTKMAERNYEVIVAVDDSASMSENGMERSTCEGVCIVEEALRRVNAGQLSVLSFGDKIKEIIPFGKSECGQSSGSTLLSNLSFNQSSTDMYGMLSKAFDMFQDIKSPKSEQLLIIISDGRGALANGTNKIKEALSRLSQVTVLFVILDCGKKSMKDMKVASFVGDEVSLVPYLSLFPFPLYILARSVSQIPSLLSESLRQWIEFDSN